MLKKIEGIFLCEIAFVVQLGHDGFYYPFRGQAITFNRSIFWLRSKRENYLLASFSAKWGLL